LTGVEGYSEYSHLVTSPSLAEHPAQSQVSEPVPAENRLMAHMQGWMRDLQEAYELGDHRRALALSEAIHEHNSYLGELIVRRIGE
jgi:hypothetical protein